MRNTIYFKWFMDSLKAKGESFVNDYEQMSINQQKDWYISYLEEHYESRTKQSNLKEWLDSQEFYELLYSYRCSSGLDQEKLVQKFEKIKQEILNKVI